MTFCGNRARHSSINKRITTLYIQQLALFFQFSFNIHFDLIVFFCVIYTNLDIKKMCILRNYAYTVNQIITSVVFSMINIVSFVVRTARQRIAQNIFSFFLNNFYYSNYIVKTRRIFFFTFNAIIIYFYCKPYRFLLYDGRVRQFPKTAPKSLRIL